MQNIACSDKRFLKSVAEVKDLAEKLVMQLTDVMELNEELDRIKQATLKHLKTRE